MKYFVMVIATICCFYNTKADNMISDKLIDALIVVESGGRSDLVGSLGEVGVLQILQPCIDDVNRVYGTDYTLDDAKDETTAREICRNYLNYWGKHYKKKTGLEPTDEILSKIWNGGPNGWKKRGRAALNVANYWRKVSAAMMA